MERRERGEKIKSPCKGGWKGASSSSRCSVDNESLPSSLPPPTVMVIACWKPCHKHAPLLWCRKKRTWIIHVILHLFSPCYGSRCIIGTSKITACRAEGYGSSTSRNTTRKRYKKRRAIELGHIWHNEQNSQSQMKGETPVIDALENVPISSAYISTTPSKWSKSEALRFDKHFFYVEDWYVCVCVCVLNVSH